MPLLVIFLFLLSGIAGLTLEVIWTRLLEHVFGATTLAVSTVLTCFMGGLALGSWLFGRFADRLRSPILAYGIVEGVVGAAAFVVPLVIEHLYPGLNRLLVHHLGNDFLLFSLGRFVAVALVLIIPATCMGATLPLLSRHFVGAGTRLTGVGARVGLLYTVNTVGAVLGVFLTTFVLLPRCGVFVANSVAGGIDLLLCATIVLLRHRLRPPGDPAGGDDPAIDLESLIEEERPIWQASRAERLVAVAAFFVSGLASMNLQVVWNRAMAMVIGSSVYSFALVLIAFLIGLAAGSAVFSRLSRRLANPVIALALVELAIAALAMASYAYIDDLPRVFGQLVTSHIPSPENHVALTQLVMFVVASLAVLPATFFMGATFPLTVRVAVGDPGRVGRAVGGVYAVNTLGAICGSFLSAFVFVPLFSQLFDGAGMQVTFFLSLSLYAATGAALLVAARGRAALRFGAAGLAVALTVVFLGTVPRWDPAAMTIGLFRFSLMKDALNEETWGDPDVRYYHDGVTTTVSVEVWGRHFSLKNNGKVDASNGEDMPTQIMVSAYPLLFHPRGPRDLDVAVIGFGSGVTVGAALEFPVRHVDAVELESAVVAASAAFGRLEGGSPDPEFDVNHLVYRPPVLADGRPNPAYDWRDPATYVVNPRLAIINNDGRNFLAASARKYDVIVSEPSNPWITGVANLFTRDHFRQASRALAPDGVFCQWVQLYELSPENIRTILRTFASVFPYVALFSAEDLSSDTMLVGSFRPLTYDLGRVTRAMADPRTRAELARAYVFTPTDVFARALLVDREELVAYTDQGGALGSGGPINTDDNAVIEFAAPRDLISFRRFAGYLATIYTPEWRHARLSRVLTGLGTGVEEGEHLAAQALSLLANGRKREAGIFVARAERLAPDAPATIEARQLTLLLAGRDAPERAELMPPDEGTLLTPEDRARLAAAVEAMDRALAEGAPRTALERLERLPAELLNRGGPWLLYARGIVHFANAAPDDTTQCQAAIDAFSELVREHPAFAERRPEIWYHLGLCHDNALHFDKAVRNLGQYLERKAVRDLFARLSAAQAAADAAAGLPPGSATIPLPPDRPGAPTLDAPGLSPRDALISD